MHFMDGGIFRDRGSQNYRWLVVDGILVALLEHKGGERTALRWKMSNLPHGYDTNGRMFVSGRWIPMWTVAAKST